MANKKSVGVGYFGGNPKTRMSNVLAGDARTGGRAKFNQTSAMFSNSPYANRPAPLSAYAKPKDMPPPTGEASVTRNRSTSLAGGLGMQAYGKPKGTANTRTPRNATTAERNEMYGNPAAMSAPIKTQVKPAETIRTVVAERLTPERKSTPMRGTNLGVSSGKTTGKTVNRSGTGGRTTGGGRATGGGYTNAGPAGMGASGRGTGGKK